MKRGEDEGKKVSFCEQYNLVAYPATFVSQGSSSSVSAAHQRALASMAESYYSYASLRKTEPMIFEASSDRKPMIIPKYESLEFHGIRENNAENHPVYKVSEIRLKPEAITSCIVPERGARKRWASETEFSSHFYPGAGDCIKPAKIETVNECGNALEMSGVVKEEEEDSVRGRNIMPDDVVRVIGQRLFEKARKTILDQQRIFSFQILELHRLIKVQRLIARSPEKLHEKNLDPNRPPIQPFTPMDNKLLHVFPLDRPPPVPKPKTDPLSLKLAPWFFHPPIGNQWLVPIKSPSEGLIYKPCAGPCFPTAGVTLGVPVLSGLNTDQDEEPSEKEGLALFPTTPSSELLKKGDEDNNDDEDGKPRVIKVVPHNRKSASESAARIFLSLQEERRIRRISSCGSHVS